MADVGGTGLDKKVGPLPAGVWAAAIGVGLLFAFYMNKRSGSANSSSNSLATAGSGTADGSVGGWVATTPTTLQTTKVFTSNEQWGQAAISYLIGQNYDAGLSDAAIRNYLGGLQVSIQQQPLVDAAIKGLGPPPELLNPISGPTPSTPITPPSQGGGGPTNTPPPTNNGGLFGFLFGLVDSFLGNVSGSVSGINVPVNGQNYQVSGSYGNDNGTITVVNPDGSKTTVDANAQATTTSNATTTGVATTTGMRSYTVVTGDTLQSISYKMYGSYLQGSKIYNANLSTIPDQQNLIPGTILSIPE